MTTCVQQLSEKTKVPKCKKKKTILYQPPPTINIHRNHEDKLNKNTYDKKKMYEI